jgi:hypothetical protein
MRLTPGARVGPYEVLAPLGSDYSINPKVSASKLLRRVRSLRLPAH